MSCGSNIIPVRVGYRNDVTVSIVERQGTVLCLLNLIRLSISNFMISQVFMFVNNCVQKGAAEKPPFVKVYFFQKWSYSVISFLPYSTIHPFRF